MNTLSTFDGISCGKIASDRAELDTENYFASEIKPSAIKCSKFNNPHIIHLGDVEKIHYTNLGIEVDTGSSSMRVLNYYIDLLIGGSPCKGISGMNQNQEGLEHHESVLFFEYLRLLEQIRLVNPDVYFLMEGVHGNRKANKIITEKLGVKPININSKLLSAQNRPRYYWTNIPNVTQPKDLRLNTREILNRQTNDCLVADNRLKWLNSPSGQKSIERSYCKINPYPKAGCLLANGHSKWNENYIKMANGKYRYLLQSELEELQTLPPGYTSCLTYNEASDCIGDGWTVDIISHILSFLPDKFKKQGYKQTEKQLTLY